MTKTSAGLALSRLLFHALSEKKAADIRVLDVSELSSITDFMVIATATSDPHLRALRVELERVIDANRVHIVGVEAPQGSGWVVVDTFDVMVHLFLPEARAKYRLEHLWKDADEVNVDKPLPVKKMAKKPKAVRKTVKKAAPRKRRAR